MSDASYTEAERATLDAMLDTLVPGTGDGRLPGAGALGLALQIERDVPELAPLVKSAVAALDERAGAGGFAALDAAARGAALRAHEERDPGLLPGLLFHTYNRYYSQPEVIAGLGLPPRPPWPKGYEMQPSDFDELLAPVRAGPRRYREV